MKILSTAFFVENLYYNLMNVVKFLILSSILYFTYGLRLTKHEETEELIEVIHDLHKEYNKTLTKEEKEFMISELDNKFIEKENEKMKKNNRKIIKRLILVIFSIVGGLIILYGIFLISGLSKHINVVKLLVKNIFGLIIIIGFELLFIKLIEKEYKYYNIYEIFKSILKSDI